MISPVPDQPDILFLLHDIARQLRVAGDRRARAHGMTRAQWVILWRVERQPGLSQKELAEIMEVEPITVARLVDRLAARGMLERRDDPADRRIWRLHLLPPAFPVLERMRGERDDVTALLAAGLSPQTLATVRQALISMKANVVADLRARPRHFPPTGPSPARPDPRLGGTRIPAGSSLTMSQTAAAPRLVAPEETPVRARSRTKLLRPLLMLGGIVVVAVVSFLYWLNGGRYVSIDNAYVRAAKVAVSTDISGTVIEVAVREGQRVSKGDLLFRLNPYKYEIALEGAKARLAEVELSLNAMKVDYQRMLRDIDAKQSQVQADQAAHDRYAGLVKGGGVTRADYDDARFRLAANTAVVASLTELARVQLARLGGNPDVDVRTMPQYLLARSQVDEAERQVKDTVFTAPFNGIATQVESIQPGMFMVAGTPAFGLISHERVWVEASPKETDITHVKLGDAVTVTVDTYPGRTWRGVVESISPASGAEFSVLPAQNASGNWVKVVQRIPLRIKVERAPGDPELRAGMSVVVSIDTGHVRHVSDLMPR
jgi:membrane fusion protein (multidrug efflux system)